MQVKQVGFIGLGTMGRPMASHLHGKAGIALQVYDVSHEACEHFRAKGVAIASSMSALASWADVVILMLPHPDIVREALLAADGIAHALRPGSIVVDMSTTGPRIDQELGRALAERGVGMVDAPVGKGPAAAIKGDLTLLMGGERETCAAVEPILRHFGQDVHYCGRLGSGQTVKLINNMVSCTNAAILAEAFAMAARAGVEFDVLTDVMAGTAADSWQLRQTVMNKALKKDFTPAFKLSLAHKDLGLALKMAEQIGAQSICLRGALAWYQEAANAGYGDLDRAALMLLADPQLRQ